MKEPGSFVRSFAYLLKSAARGERSIIVVNFPLSPPPSFSKTGKEGEEASKRDNDESLKRNVGGAGRGQVLLARTTYERCGTRVRHFGRATSKSAPIWRGWFRGGGWLPFSSQSRSRLFHCFNVFRLNQSDPPQGTKYYILVEIHVYILPNALRSTNNDPPAPPNQTASRQALPFTLNMINKGCSGTLTSLIPQYFGNFR